MTQYYWSSFLTSNRDSPSNDDLADTLARTIHVVERIERLLVVKLSSHVDGKAAPSDRNHDAVLSVQVKWSRSQPQAETINNIVGSRRHDSAKVRCVCLPNRGTARILLQLYLEKAQPMSNSPHTPTLKDILECVYAQTSRAEIPDLLQISLFLSIFATGARYETTDGRTTLCSRYWQMTALYILAEQRQASLLVSVEVLQTVVNILLLMQHQQRSSETFRLLHTLGMSLSSDTPEAIGEQTSEGELITRRRLKCQLERMSR
jgi:hypothetical protein